MNKVLFDFFMAGAKQDMATPRYGGRSPRSKFRRWDDASRLSCGAAIPIDSRV